MIRYINLASMLFIFSMSLLGADLVSVSRWTMRDGGTFITRDGQADEKWYSDRGMHSKRHLYFAYQNKPSHDHNIAVKSFRWRVKKTANGNEDWVAAMDGAVSDSWWTSRGHDSKTFEGWVFKSRPSNPPPGYAPVKVNRWDDRNGNWVTAVEDSREESELVSKNARNKSFLFWALKKVQARKLVGNVDFEIFKQGQKDYGFGHVRDKSFIKINQLGTSQVKITYDLDLRNDNFVGKNFHYYVSTKFVLEDKWGRRTTITFSEKFTVPGKSQRNYPTTKTYSLNGDYSIIGSPSIAQNNYPIK